MRRLLVWSLFNFFSFLGPKRNHKPRVTTVLFQKTTQTAWSDYKCEIPAKFVSGFYGISGKLSVKTACAGGYLKLTKKMATISTPNRYDRLEFPAEDQLQEARDILKPPGIMSKAYNKFQLKKVEREYAIARHHPLSQEALAKKSQTDTLDATGNSEEIPYFRVKTLHNFPSTYDRIKGVDSGYDPKLHRDDRHNAKSRGLRVNEEERLLNVPNLSSSVYGHPGRKPLENPSRKHVHVEVCKKDFLRLTGTNMGMEE